jgi:hypothetical protein
MQRMQSDMVGWLSLGVGTCMRLRLGVRVADVCEDFLVSSPHQADFASAPYTDLFLSSQTKYV